MNYPVKSAHFTDEKNEAQNDEKTKYLQLISNKAMYKN